MELGTVLNECLSGSQKPLFRVLIIGTSAYFPSRGQGPNSFRDGVTICLFLVVSHGWLSNVRKACLLCSFWGQVKDFCTAHLVPDPGIIFLFIVRLILSSSPIFPMTKHFNPCHSDFFKLHVRQWRQMHDLLSPVFCFQVMLADGLLPRCSTA